MTDRKTPYVSVHLTPEARDILRQATLTLSATTGHRVTMSDAVEHLAAIEKQHREQVEPNTIKTP